MPLHDPSTGPLRIVVAPDSFKGSISATDAAAALGEGWSSTRPADELRLLPQADGGEGTLDAVARAIPGTVRRHVHPVTAPDGRTTTGDWLELPGRIAVIELAQPSGLTLMARLDPLHATTTGLGQVMAAALDSGMRRLIVGLGGSASTDGGAGALQALGFALRDGRGRELPPGGAALASLHSVDHRGGRRPPPGGITLLTDVDAPLLGPSGAAAVFGPQKGASPADVLELDAALARFADVLGGDAESPGAGAAGGTGFGLATALSATVEPGSDFLGALTGLDDRLRTADIVVTGEGRFDATSLGGKVVGRLIEKADALGVRVVVVAGQFATRPTAPSGAEIDTWSLSDLAGSPERAMADPHSVLREAGRRAALALRW